MLQNMRDSAKSWTIKVILVFVALSFVIWGVGGKDKNKGGVVATIQGEEIRYPEFKRVYDNMYEFLKRNNNMDVNNEFWEKIIRRNALNGIILKKLVINMANEMGVVVSDKELADRIQADTNFFKDGKFDRALYLQALRANRLKPADFEEDYRNSVKQEKLEKSLTASLFASKQEVLDGYIYENEKIDINYIAISPTFFERKVEIKEEELVKYYEASKEKFRIDEKITAEILVAEPSSFVTGITLDEKRVSDFYNMNKDKFNVPKRIKASHILFRESGTTAQKDSPAHAKAESV
jgi:peptidyl-prolyl cis-trans isomerase D